MVYFGVVNLVHDSYIMGAVDVWKCRSCAQLFCEDKRYGVTDLAPEVGLPKVYPDSKWAALICTRDKTSNWTLTQVKPDGIITHSCTPETKLELHVNHDYDLEPGMSAGVGKHRLIILENFVNSAVDVQTGQKHVTTTNAYQALGKPFSFTPPLSAAVIEPSKYNVLNFASIIFLAGAIATALIAWTGQSLPSNMLSSFQLFFGLAAVVFGASAYFVWTRKSWSPLLGIAISLVALVTFTVGKFALTTTAAGFSGIADFLLVILFGVGMITGYFARVKMNALIEKQWHPLDMPAYG